MKSAIYFVLFAVTAQLVWGEEEAKDRGLFGGYEEVCYEKYGCFSTAPPFSGGGRYAVLPDKPEDIPTRFILFTRTTGETGLELETDNAFGLQVSGYNGRLRTKIIVHGWNDFHYWPLHLKNSFLKHEDCNVILVRCLDFKFYPKSAANSRVIGAKIAEFVRFLIAETHTNLTDFHILGHSLGAHVAAYAGERLMPGLGRLTGMDPAGPMFRDVDPKVRLDETDAEFVDVLHTDGDSFFNMLTLSGGFATDTPSGHIDIFANGGLQQPGCYDKSWIEALVGDGIYDGVRYIGGCHHTRGYEYPNESLAIDSCPWRAYHCNGGWEEFKTGRCLHCPNDANGDPAKYCNNLVARAVKPADGSVNNAYYLSTGRQWPYCRFHYHVQLELQDTKNHDQKGNAWVKLIGQDGIGTDFLDFTEEDETVTLKPGGTYDFLVLSPKGIANIDSIELKWEHNAKFYDVTQWQFSKPTIYPKRITIFSGEYQTEAIFEDNSNKALKSKGSCTYNRIK